MDAKEFLQQVTPAAKRSRLAPFMQDIEMLRSAGCSLAQVQEFLKINGVVISRAGLSAYLLRKQESESNEDLEPDKG